jgi:hypothetical protein
MFVYFSMLALVCVVLRHAMTGDLLARTSDYWLSILSISFEFGAFIGVMYFVYLGAWVRLFVKES